MSVTSHPSGSELVHLSPLIPAGFTAAGPTAAPERPAGTTGPTPPSPAGDVVILVGETDPGGTPRRLARFRRFRRFCFALTTIAVAGLAVLWVVHDDFELVSPAVVLPLGGGVVAWFFAVIHTFRLHSNDIDCRLRLSQLEATQRQMVTPERASAAGSPGNPASSVGTGDLGRLQSRAAALVLQASTARERVDHALKDATLAAAIGALGVVAGVGTKVLLTL